MGFKGKPRGAKGKAKAEAEQKRKEEEEAQLAFELEQAKEESMSSGAASSKRQLVPDKPEEQGGGQKKQPRAGKFKTVQSSKSLIPMPIRDYFTFAQMVQQSIVHHLLPSNVSLAFILGTRLQAACYAKQKYEAARQLLFMMLMIDVGALNACRAWNFLCPEDKVPASEPHGVRFKSTKTDSCISEWSGVYISNVNSVVMQLCGVYRGGVGSDTYCYDSYDHPDNLLADEQPDAPVHGSDYESYNGRTLYKWPRYYAHQIGTLECIWLVHMRLWSYEFDEAVQLVARLCFGKALAEESLVRHQQKHADWHKDAENRERWQKSYADFEKAVLGRNHPHNLEDPTNQTGTEPRAAKGERKGKGKGCRDGNSSAARHHPENHPGKRPTDTQDESRIRNLPKRPKTRQPTGKGQRAPQGAENWETSLGQRLP